MSNSFSYEAAMSEIEMIIQKIQSEEITLDQLSEMILRAKKLYSECDKKLRSVEKEIEEIENNGDDLSFEE
jgi:exodeoxyribonuclease VII small subunit